MSTLTRDTNRAKRHIAGADGRPLCGGGHGARSAQFQVDLGDDVNCAQCSVIDYRQRNTPPPAI